MPARLPCDGRPGRHTRPLQTLRTHLRAGREGPLLGHLRLRQGNDAPARPGPALQGRGIPRGLRPWRAHPLAPDEYSGLAASWGRLDLHQLALSAISTQLFVLADGYRLPSPKGSTFL